MASATSAGKVQHVPRASSDELLRKFADANSPRKAHHPIRAPLARKKRRPPRAAAPSRDRGPGSRSEGGGIGAEWKALLQHPPSRRAALLRRVGIRSELGAREIAGLGLLLTAALEKTWRKTVEGTSRMLVAKHCNRHVRLISSSGGDAV